MSSHSKHHDRPRHGSSMENTDTDIVRGPHLEPLLREIRSLLRWMPIRHFHPQSRRQANAIARRIDDYLDRFVSTPLAMAAAAASVRSSPDPDMLVDEACPLVVASGAGVWITMWRLIDWDQILPLLPGYASACYAPAITGLPETERTVFLLHRMGGLSLADIGHKLGIDVADCERLLGKALGAIARQVDGAN